MPSGPRGRPVHVKKMAVLPSAGHHPRPGPLGNALTSTPVAPHMTGPHDPAGTKALECSHRTKSPLCSNAFWGSPLPQQGGNRCEAASLGEATGNLVESDRGSSSRLRDGTVANQLWLTSSLPGAQGGQSVCHLGNPVLRLGAELLEGPISHSVSVHLAPAPSQGCRDVSVWELAVG